jgi:hypothetical protein
MAVCVNLWYYIVNVLVLIRDIHFVLTRFVGVSFDMASTFGSFYHLKELYQPES